MTAPVEPPPIHFPAMCMVHRRPRYLTPHQPRPKTTSDRRSEPIRRNGGDEAEVRRATQSYALHRPRRKQAPTAGRSRDLVGTYGAEVVAAEHNSVAATERGELASEVPQMGAVSFPGW